MKIPRQQMAEQKPEERIKNFKEVPFGFTDNQAVSEASRCLQCKKAPCRNGCPVEIDIPAFIRLIKEEEPIRAAEKIKETNALPAVCGRVCPQEDQCEKACVLAGTGQPIAIGTLERFAADRQMESGLESVPDKTPSGGEKVAVIGSGPAGLTAAADLAGRGFAVSVFEALHEPGGVLTYGIPEFRLPKELVQQEVDTIRRRGVEIKLNQVVGNTVSIPELFDNGYQAVFIASGAGLPRFMNIPGENLNGVYSANEYLTRSNLMKAYLFPAYDTPIIRGDNVAVIGGGNVAMDSARTALRLGARNVTIIYRRTRNEAPARAEEIERAEEEGVQFRFLTLPLRYREDNDGRVEAVECLKMKLGEPDASGRPRPIPIADSEFIIECDQAIVAIGNDPNPLIPRRIKGLEMGRKGTIAVDPETGLTSIEGIYAGGDIATGAATVIEAMGAGKKAARAIAAYLNKPAAERSPGRILVTED